LLQFYPSKNLGSCGEGGAIVTEDPALAQQVRMLREHGSVRKYEHSFPGYNFRMEGIQGAVLNAKLKYLDQWNDSRRALALQYHRLLAGSPLTLPSETPGSRHVYHLYVVQTEDREALRQQLGQHGIETGLHYPIPLHLQEAYKSLGYKAGDFPVCERLAQHILSLPMYPELSSEAVDYVAATLHECLQSPVEEPTGTV
jgi:dTDP-4-amino-4,6-dideoxygalactose transaminase